MVALAGELVVLQTTYERRAFGTNEMLRREGDTAQECNETEMKIVTCLSSGEIERARRDEDEVEMKS